MKISIDGDLDRVAEIVVKQLIMSSVRNCDVTVMVARDADLHRLKGNDGAIALPPLLAILAN